MNKSYIVYILYAYQSDQPFSCIGNTLLLCKLVFTTIRKSARLGEVVLFKTLCHSPELVTRMESLPSTGKGKKL